MELLPITAPYPLAQTSYTPRPSGNSVADTQIQLLRLLDNQQTSNYMHNDMEYEDWRDQTWEILPSCNLSSSFSTGGRDAALSSYTGDQQNNGKTPLLSMLVYAVVIIALLSLLVNWGLKKTEKAA